VEERVFGVFGYGSLVNPDTLRTSYIGVHRARLKGWGRNWLRRPKEAGDFAPLENLALLSASPNADDTWLDGMIVLDHVSNLPALDEREVLYERVELNANAIDWPDGPPAGVEGIPLYVYSAGLELADNDLSILRSYLDAVLQGYFRAFGEVGITQFLATTHPQGLTILEDRSTPLYPRPIVLDDEECVLIDHHTA